MPGDLDVAVHDAAQPHRHALGVLGVVDGLEQDRELVAADARDRVAGACAPSRRRATTASIASPAWWPSESLMSLKSSMSR